jgi:hypothetical protein
MSARRNDDSARATLAGRQATARQVRAVVAGLLLLPSATGCYTSVPVWEGTPAPNAEITMGLSDRGRTTLAAQLGPGARRISGRLVQASDSAYIVRVTGVEYISNSYAGTWSGEQVVVSRDLVSGITERRFSRSRSWIAAGIAVVGVALVSTIAIKGFGTDPASTKTPDGGGNQQ